MNTDKLRNKLIAVARATPQDDRVPYAFEKRILAHIAAQPVMDATFLWARALWRAAVPCVAITMVLGAFSFLPSTSNADQTQDLSASYEHAMRASTDQTEEIW